MNLHIKLLNEILNIKGEQYDRKGKNAKNKRQLKNYKKNRSLDKNMV